MTNSSPPAPSKALRAVAEVVENEAESPGNHRLVLAIPDWPGAEPGQFVMLSPGGPGEAELTDPLLPRPMAVYRGHAPAPGGRRAEVEFLLKVAGRGTHLLADRVPGQSIRLVGPLGSAFTPIAPGSRAILVGGGTGIASLYELASRGAQQADVQVIMGARREADLMGVDDFLALGVEVQVTTEDGSRGRQGRVTDALGELLEGPGPPARLFACGPTPMMRACAEIAEQKRLECQVSLENNMACGFGVCLGCAVPVHSGGYSLVCRAGPVYPADQVVWEDLP